MSLPRVINLGLLRRFGQSTTSLGNRLCSSASTTNSKGTVRKTLRKEWRIQPLGGSPTSESAAGQPTHLSHPSLIQKGEITPGITIEEYRSRRDRLLNNIVAYAPKTELHVVIIPASPKKYMTEKIPYVFRQDSDFLYLSGCLEPDTCLVLVSRSKQFESVLFLRGKDPHAELWDGPRTGCEEGVGLFGVDQCLPAEDISVYLSSLLKTTTSHLVWYDYLSEVSPQFFRVVKDVVPNSKALDSPRSFIHRLRLIKSKAEQQLMRETCRVGGEAMVRTIRTSQPGDNEAHLFARVDFHSRMQGAQYLAYPPVVAGGKRANVIHYINNNQIIEKGDLVLMDAGCELNGYTSDITRTWPISGSWSSPQRALYEMLYKVQLGLLAELGNRPSLNQLFAVMCKLLGRGLQELGVLKGANMSDDELSRAAYGFCPHHVSHYLGMDVHDTSLVPRDIPLQPGMVFTVEPGIYVNSDNKMANPLYHGLGMRIEDDLLITENGIEVLTASCPKHPDLIRNLLNRSA